MKRYALISVSDRSGLIEFAQGLKKQGFLLLTTSGSGKYLKENGIDSISIEDYTGQQEILGGRVKTLHPMIHGGILARRDVASDITDLERQKIATIDVVAVNLYPFEEQLAANPNKPQAELVEYIDIGGPTMIRAAAKNFASVYAVIDPNDYHSVLSDLANDNKELSIKFRQNLSAKVFIKLAHYNNEIGKYLSRGLNFAATSKEEDSIFPESTKINLSNRQSLRYGENPHQRGCLYEGDVFSAVKKDNQWKLLQGKELSYNNILDADAGLKITRSLANQSSRFRSGVIVNIVKHLSPCGIAIGKDGQEALKLAKLSDPRSHFGGIIGFSSEVDGLAAKECVKDFCEIIIAPTYSKEALEIFSKKPAIRVIEANFTAEIQPEIRNTFFGFIAQEQDLINTSVVEAELVSGNIDKLSDTFKDLELAWSVVTHVKSNAIVLVKDGMLLAAGGGQTSRIDAAQVAVMKANDHGHNLNGSVAASDAFFPFPDTIEYLAKAGVKAIVTPCGSKNDSEVIALAKKLDITLFFTKERHFKH